MPVPPSDRIDRLSDSQIDFYLIEYQRVLRMFESYSSAEAHELKARLRRFIEMLTREAQQRQERVPVKKDMQAARTAA